MNLRLNLIRLAYANPTMRKDLLPLIQKHAGARPLGPGVHLIENLFEYGPNVRLVFRELGGDLLGSEVDPGYYLDAGGILKQLLKAQNMSPSGEAKARKALVKLLSRMSRW